MGAKDTMQNFFMGMGGQMISGYGARTVSTPMGPFKWDDNINMWVNTNNGVVMSNISFQDQFAMIDYGTTDVSGLQGNLLSVSISPISWGNFREGSAGGDIWVSAAGPVSIDDATAVTFTISGASNINISLTLADGGVGGTLIYSKNNAFRTIYSGPITMANGDTLKIGVFIPEGVAGSATITVTNVTNQTVLQAITGDFI
jgi:hypothetical protein